MNVQSRPENTAKSDVSVRPLQKSDLSAADHIMRVAFGTFFGVPDPASFMGDASYVGTRWKANPDRPSPPKSTTKSSVQILVLTGAVSVFLGP